ncbi:MAG: amidohydrolase family protein [Thermotogota bacterium]|nr:amidohydrolase family protein [Thermotogota bacterium]
MKKLLTGLNIYNSESQRFDSKNILIDGNKFKAIDHERLDDSYDVLNYRNHYLYPSFVDSHAHLLGIGIELSRFSLKDVDTKDALRMAILTQKNSFIILRGWDEAKLDFFPDKQFIDSIITDTKCLLIRKCGHTGTCNSTLISELTQRGIQEMDDSDYNRGILKERTLEQAMQLVHYQKQDIALYLTKAAQALRKTGITSMHTDDYHSNDINDLVNIVMNQKELRVFEKINPESVNELKNLIQSGIFKGKNNDFATIRSVKVFLDGSFGAKSAFLSQPYEQTNINGVLYMKPEEFAEYVKICEENHLQLLVHVIGDAALDVALEGFQQSISSYNPLRHRIIHLQMASQKQLKRIKETNLFLSIQPVFYTSDYDMALKIIGKKRMEEIAYPFKKALDMGIELSLSTDAPVEDYNPFRNMISALNFFDIKTAFEKYTVASAKAAFWEDRVGKIENGFLADGFLSTKNIFEMNESELSQFQPKAVIFNGQVNNNHILD